MAVLLRVDVDNPYGWSNLYLTLLNRFSNKWRWFPKIEAMGYLWHLRKFVDDINDRGIKATFFFRRITVPKNLDPFADHELAFHAVKTDTYEHFKRDLSKVSLMCRRKLNGFSKHGSGIDKLASWHTAKYEPEKYLKWAALEGLKYFSGNGENPCEQMKFVNGIRFYPSAFWVNQEHRAKRFTVNWLADECQNRDIVVIIHPFMWAVNRQVRGDWEKIVNNVDNFKLFSS